MSAAAERIGIREFARRDGCNDKLVRRAIERGSLKIDEDGKLDAALVKTAWRRSAIDGQKPRRPGAEPGAEPAAAAPPPDSSAPRAPPPPPAAGPEESEEQRIARLANPGLPTFASSAQREKAAMAEMRELELARKKGELVDVEAARILFFSAFRGVRDHWLSFPSGFSAIIAAKLDADPDLVSEVLIEFVRKHAAKLTDPAFRLQ